MVTTRKPASADAVEVQKILAQINQLIAGKRPRQALRLVQHLRLELMTREGELRVAEFEHAMALEA